MTGHGGDLHGLEKVSAAVEQAERNVGAIQVRIDVERHAGSLRTRLTAGPSLFQKLPGGSPILWVLLRPTKGVGDDLVVPTLRWQQGQAGLDDGSWIVFEEGSGVEPADKNPTQQAIASVHDSPYPLSQVGRRLRHARVHHADKVGFDLEVDVVGVWVELRRAAIHCRYAPPESTAGGIVGVPQWIFRIAERRSEIVGGCIPSMFLENRNEGHVDVEIVLLDRVFDPIRRPLRKLLLGNHPAHVAKLGRSAVADPDHLSGPAAADLVFESR